MTQLSRNVPKLDVDPALVKVMLRKVLNLDLSYYRDDFICRRVISRMYMQNASSFTEYLKLLKSDPAERVKLLDSLAINVSEFFRDPPVWRVFREKVLMPCLDNLTRGNHLRIWSAGCSRGQEPYTIALMLLEHVSDENLIKRISILATDIDHEALESAVKGVYPERSVSNVPRHLLMNFFRPLRTEGSKKYYAISDKVKRMVKFKRHDLTKDPPPFFIDIVVCRNVLIYFSLDKQVQVIQKFHAALRDGGFLMLGASEFMPPKTGELFKVIDSQAKIFCKHSQSSMFYGRPSP